MAIGHLLYTNRHIWLQLCQLPIAVHLYEYSKRSGTVIVHRNHTAIKAISVTSLTITIAVRPYILATRTHLTIMLMYSKCPWKRITWGWTGLSANVRREKEDNRRLRREDCFGSFLPKRESKVTNLVFVNRGSYVCSCLVSLLRLLLIPSVLFHAMPRFVDVCTCSRTAEGNRCLFM